MSASREKKFRKDSPNEAVSAAQREAQQKKKKSILTAVLVTLFVVLVIGTIVLFRGPFFRVHSTALTVGDHEISPIMLRYYYADSFSLVSEQYGDMMNYLYSNGTRFDEAQYSEDGTTWGEYLLGFATDLIRTDFAVYDLAQKENYVPGTECEEAIASTKQMLELYANMYGVSPDAYVRQIYGNGSSLDSYIEYQTVRNTVADYLSHKEAGFTYTADEIAAAYNEAPTDYNAYTFHSYLVSGYTEELDEEANAAALAAAEETAKQIAEEGKGNLDRFIELCKENAALDADANFDTLRNEYLGSEISSFVREWITDPARQEGDTTAILNEDYGCYALYFVSSSENDYATVNARVIPVDLATDDAGEIDWTKSEEYLTAIQTGFDNGQDDLDATFESLAVTYSSDEETAYDGAKFENVSHKTDTLSAAVLEWLFDEARQPGDSAMLRDDTSATFVYFESFGDLYRDHLIVDGLRSSDYESWYKSVTENVTAEEHSFGMSYLYRKLVYSYSSY